MHALQRAGTAVCEPMVSLRLEVPASTTGAVLSALARLGGALGSPSPDAELALIEAVLPAVRVRDLQRQLPGLTGGEGVLESSFAGYRRVSGQPPTRQRTTASPLDLDEYRAGLAGHRAAAKSR
jgi:ribosomal protection tetracycline resistance protein